MGYPTVEEQRAILARFLTDDPQLSLTAVCSPARIAQAQEEVRRVRVHPDVMDYIGLLCEKTRSLEQVILGASPRAALVLMRVAQAYSAITGMDYVTPQTVRRVASPVLAHRLVLRTAFGAAGQNAAAVQEALDATPVPTEKVEQTEKAE